MGDLDLEAIVGIMDRGGVICEWEVCQVLIRLREVLITEDILVRIAPPVVICGDTHGQYEDVQKLLRETNYTRERTYLFMGDYVDRGRFSVNTFLLLAIRKLQVPGRFFLLRGNHETRRITQMYGFYRECLDRYGHSGVWAQFMIAFDVLPYMAPRGEAVLSLHGAFHRGCPSLI
jgi:diadenosine tetraphosphatase ApaH/serine/threonine PP2A family protein phosphatase